MDSSQEAISRVIGNPGGQTREITAPKARALLRELANLTDPGEQNLLRFERHFGDWIKTFTSSSLKMGSQRRTYDTPIAGMGLILSAVWSRFGLILSFGGKLRNAWEQPTVPRREIGMLVMLLEIAQLYSEATGKWFALMDEPMAIVMLEAIHSADRMRICGNPQCPAPYFIASRRSQKFCCDACALPAQREYKRKWWNEHRAKKRKAGRAKVLSPK